MHGIPMCPSLGLLADFEVIFDLQEKWFIVCVTNVNLQTIHLTNLTKQNPQSFNLYQIF
jgi:hypothetical protein